MKAFLVFMLAITTTQVFAQNGESRGSFSTRSESRTTELRLIPTIGLAEMELQGSTVNNLDSGVSVGGLLELGGGSTTFQTGLLYNQFGSKSDNGSLKFNLDYLSIPVLAKINFSGSPEGGAYLKAGVMPGFLTSHTAKASNGLSGTIDNVNSFDLPAVVGLGGSIPTSSIGTFNIEGAFARSLLKINSEGSGSVYNQGFILSVGYSISI